METVWEKLIAGYTFMNYELADRRTREYPLAERPFTILALMGAYALFATRLGPWLMRHRKPFELRGPLVLYNLLQVVSNGYLFYVGGRDFWLHHYSWRCQPLETEYGPEEQKGIGLIYMYFWLKIIDLLDTVFFVLRKRQRQISFLHVYHHAMMIFLSYCSIKYMPGGHGTLIGFINVFVHTVMYAYYLYSVLYPGHIWWKKVITQIQLIQHTMVLIHQGQLFFHNPCGIHMFQPCMLVPQALLMIFMFGDFYRRSYCFPSAQRPKAQ